jgi:hypothetical protein
MRQRPTLEPLEPRILFSADTPSALAAALVGTPDAEHRLLDAEGEFAAQTASHEIVFIDARTPHSAQLVEDIARQSGRQVEVVVLDAERNGLEQISETLAGRETWPRCTSSPTVAKASCSSATPSSRPTRLNATQA